MVDDRRASVDRVCDDLSLSLPPPPPPPPLSLPLPLSLSLSLSLSHPREHRAPRNSFRPANSLLAGEGFSERRPTTGSELFFLKPAAVACGKFTSGCHPWLNISPPTPSFRLIVTDTIYKIIFPLYINDQGK